VGLTWTKPAASGRVSGWEVLAEETLSDHLYIVMDVAIGDVRDDSSFGTRGSDGSSGRRRKNFPRWAATHWDEDLIATAAMAVAWTEESPVDEETEAGAVRLKRDLHAICDSCMPRSGAPRRAGAVY
jgi:hypothetical protein